MSKKHRGSQWYLQSGIRLAVGVGFGPWYRNLLVDTATRLTEHVEVRRTGVRQPYGLIWVGDVRPGKRLPGELVEAILDEFPAYVLGPLFPAGYDDDEDRVFIVLDREFAYAEMYVAMLGRLLEPYVRPIVPDQSIVPIVHLGKGVQGDAVPDAVCATYEALCPTSMAFGAFTEDGFVPLVWRSDRRAELTYGAALR